MDRGERRRRDFVVGVHARDEHLRVVHPDGVVDCVCEKSAAYFRKRGALGCRGSKKGAAGTSKRGSCCKGGFEMRATVHARHAGRRLCRDWQAWGGDRDDYAEPRGIDRWRGHGMKMF